MPYRVIYSPEATRQLEDLYIHIASEGSPMAAERYTSAVVATCESLKRFPHRGSPRSELRSGLRVTHHRKRTLIAYTVDDETMQVDIVGVFHGGQDYAATLAANDPE